MLCRLLLAAGAVLGLGLGLGLEFSHCGSSVAPSGLMVRVGGGTGLAMASLT